MTMQVIAAVAEFERTHARISRAKAAGKTFGRPPALSPEQQDKVARRIASGDPSQLSRERTTMQTVIAS
jgi:putative DNA-invertase from lambdoid prophage Rac